MLSGEASSLARGMGRVDAAIDAQQCGAARVQERRTGQRIGQGGAGNTWPKTEPMHDAPGRPSTSLAPSHANYFSAISLSHLASCSGCDKMRSTPASEWVARCVVD
jgi:hypothetical protein